MAVERQTSSLPPAQPSYILRGHTSQIHSVQFLRQNSRLLTGDADGWIVYWKLESKRALAVWRAHDAAILGTAEWAKHSIITHGRDNNLRIWQLRPSDEPALSTTLPAENADPQQPKPWLLHTLPVNTLNFCAFSMCPAKLESQSLDFNKELDIVSDKSILVAVPARDDNKIEVYQFPEEKLRFVIPRVQATDTGMAMAVKLVHHSTSNSILVFVGYEGGVTAVHRLPSIANSALQSAELVYLSKPHAQPILSLDVSLNANTYFTSSADAKIAAHQIPDLPPAIETTEDNTVLKTPDGNPIIIKNDGLRSSILQNSSQVSTREETPTTPLPEPSDSKAGDTPSNPSESLEFSKKPIPSAPAGPSLSFAKQPIPAATPKAAGLSSLLSSANSKAGTTALPPQPPPLTVAIQPPFKTTNTKHAGQQSLRVRSDGRLLVTGGWDSRVRIYSAKTLKEVAVLKWHKEGVYAVDFAQTLESKDLQETQTADGEVARRETGLGKLQRQREEKMQLGHWVAAGAKDGKVSLWEVF